MNAAKLELRTSMDWNWAANLLLIDKEKIRIKCFFLGNIIECLNVIPAAEFKLFDDIGDFFKTVRITMGSSFRVRDDQKSGALKEQHFIGVNNLGKIGQRAFQFLDVRNEHVDNRRPCLD